MYQIYDKQNSVLFYSLAFSTIDKAREYATKWYAEWGASINELEKLKLIEFCPIFLDPDFESY